MALLLLLLLPLPRPSEPAPGRDTRPSIFHEPGPGPDTGRRCWAARPFNATRISHPFNVASGGGGGGGGGDGKVYVREVGGEGVLVVSGQNILQNMKRKKKR